MTAPGDKGMLKRRGQSILEYAVLIIIVMAVFLSMSNYVKRGIQGRWKSAVDDLGDQYDPRLVNSSVLHTMATNSDTYIYVTPGQGGYYTNRIDISNSVETKEGFVTVGSACIAGNCIP
jgi:uncharacterized protein (UPF0333 family)